MVTERLSTSRRIWSAARKHRWASLAIAVLGVSLTVAFVPLNRTGSMTFTLTQTAVESPFGGVSVCVPSNARVSIGWTAMDPGPAFRMLIQPPGAGMVSLAGPTGSAVFDSGDGSFFVSAENFSTAAGLVDVTVSWASHASVYQTYFVPQAECQAL